MRLAAATAVLGVLALYVLLVLQVPAHFGWFHPRGGIATLGVSLAMAYGAIALGTHPHRPVRERFELTFAGWLWMLVQAGAMLWLGRAMA